MAITNIGNLDVGNVHVEDVLTSATIEFSYPDLVGPKFTSLVRTTKQSNRYNIHNADEWNRSMVTNRGPGGSFNQVEFSLSKDTFFCNGHGLENGIPWEVLANADDWATEQLNGIEIARKLKRLVDVKKEVVIAADLTTAGNYASGFTEDLDAIAGHNFDDTGVNGIDVLLSYIEDIYVQTGGSNLVMGVSADCWRIMLTDANFLPTFTPSLTLQKAQVAEVLGVQEIVILRAQKNTKDAGETPSRSSVWGSNKIVIATVGGETDMVPSTLREFRWTANPITQGDAFVRSLDDVRSMNRYIQYGEYYDHKLCGVNTSGKIISGVLLENVYIAL